MHPRPRLHKTMKEHQLQMLIGWEWQFHAKMFLRHSKTSTAKAAGKAAASKPSARPESPQPKTPAKRKAEAVPEDTP